MSVLPSITHKGIGQLVLVSVLALASLTAGAIETTISAQYRGGGSGRFESTTPPAANCSIWGRLCITNITVDIPLAYDKLTIRGTGDPRDLYYLQMPGRREVDVYHEQTGEPHRLVLEFTAVGHRVYSDDYYSNPVKLTTQLAGGCKSMSGLGAQTPRTYTFLWRLVTPQSPTPCTISNYVVEDGVANASTTSNMAVAYTLDMPPSYRMKPGIYRGSTTYRVGPGGDFDFGNNVTGLSDNTLTLNFVLDVQHDFIFDFPPGSDRAVLEPEGGWMAWLNGGRVPQRLYRDLPMQVWSTGPLKVYKLCDYDMGDRCGIRNEKGEGVPVHVLITLPEGVRYRGGPVQRLKIPTGPAAAVQLESVMPTINRPGQLHFEVKRDDVVPMFNRPGMTYSGKVTIVFDSEL